VGDDRFAGPGGAESRSDGHRMVMAVDAAHRVVSRNRAGGDDRGDRQPGDRLRRERANARRHEATAGASERSSARRGARPAGARHMRSPGAGG